MCSSSWIRGLLSRPENAFMCAVDGSYIRDRFNLTGLEETMPDYEAAARVVLDDVSASRAAAEGDPDARSAAEVFYGLVHARYVMTPRGVAKMLEKYVAGRFGHCPRENCKRSAVLPVGLCDVLGEHTVRIYCPKCMEVYTPPAGMKGAAVDGAYFGTGFPHMALMTRPEYIPPRPRGRIVSKLYGFQVHDSAYDLQQKAANEYRRSTQQGRATTSTANAVNTFASTNTSIAAASSTAVATEAVSTTTTKVSSNAAVQTRRPVNTINACRRVPLSKR